MIIYKIQNLINGKIYIGQTTRALKERWNRHRSESNCKNMAISRAIKKYGEDNFSVEVVCECGSIEELNEKEVFYIKKFQSLCPFGYNMVSGGSNFYMSEQTKQKISLALKGKKKSQEHINKVTESRRSTYKNFPELIKPSAKKGVSLDSSTRKSLSKGRIGSSKYTGVIVDGNYFRTEFYFKGNRSSMTFNTEIEAAHAYDVMCVNYGVDPINFPNDIWDNEKIESLRRKPKIKISKFYGVRKIKNRWQVILWANGKRNYIGSYKTELEAAFAADLALEGFGLPKRNFPEE